METKAKVFKETEETNFSTERGIFTYLRVFKLRSSWIEDYCVFGDVNCWVIIYNDCLNLLRICWVDWIGNGEENRADRNLLCTLDLCD